MAMWCSGDKSIPKFLNPGNAALPGFLFLPPVLLMLGQNWYFCRLTSPYERFRNELDTRMKIAFDSTWEAANKYGTDLRTAAFVVSVERVATAFKLRGVS